MNKKLLIGLVVVVVGAGGAAFFAMNQNDDNTSTTQTSQSNEDATETTKENDSQPTFNPQITGNKSFVATIEGTSEGEQAIEGTIESDGQGNLRFVGTTVGESAEYYILADGRYIICQEGACFSTSSETSGFSVDDYNVTDDDVAEFRETASYIGREDCPAGSCDVWQVTDEGVETKIYISTKDSLVSQVTGTDEGDTFKVVYEYKEVTITPPSDVQDISNFSQ